jgi:uncharacterized repeat protein (TIGR03803 family)
MFRSRQEVTLSALTLALLSTLLPLAARPAQAQTEAVVEARARRPTETVLHNFGGGDDGAGPVGNLTSHGGNFYGTTNEGGAFGGNGTVFELSPNGSGGWNETVLYTFGYNSADGTRPNSSVIFDSAGNLYGTTVDGGAVGPGMVFELSPVGTSWTETVLYSFCSQPDCADGKNPESDLIMDAAGNLYGTTFFGGGNSGGTVFELSPSGGGWIEQVIYDASDDIAAGVTMDAAGNIYGATSSTVFELSPNGSGGWNPSVIHAFTGAPKDGAVAAGTPVLDRAGNLYGTTERGGAKNFGAVYKLSPGKKGNWTEKILHSFKNSRADGNEPWAGVVLDADGNIYGTTVTGGKYGYRHGGYGTLFELVAPVGVGRYREKILWNFNIADGEYPYGSLILDSAGNLYGTTAEGGPDFDGGVVFKVTP